MNQDQLSALTISYITGELAGTDKLLFEKTMHEHPGLRAEVEQLQTLWEELGLLPGPQPSAALRAQFYQKLNATVNPKPVQKWWKRSFVLQCAFAAAIFVVGVAVGRVKPTQVAPGEPSNNEVSQLRTQVEGLRETVALSLLDKQSPSSRLEGISWGSQVDRPDQELLTALLTTLNHDQNINVRLASLDALEKYTSDAAVRKALEQSIPAQDSPLVQIALIDSLVHIRDTGAAKEFKQLSGNNGVNAAVRQRARWGLKKLNFE